MKCPCSLTLGGAVVLFVLVCECDALGGSFSKDFGFSVDNEPDVRKERLDAELSPYCHKLHRYSSVILQTLLQKECFIYRLYPPNQDEPDVDTIVLLLQFLSPICAKLVNVFKKDTFMTIARSNRAKFAEVAKLPITERERLWPFHEDRVLFDDVDGQCQWFAGDILDAKTKEGRVDYSRVVVMVWAMFMNYAVPEKRAKWGKTIDHENRVKAWILTIVKCKDNSDDSMAPRSSEIKEPKCQEWMCYVGVVGTAAFFFYGIAAYKWGWIPFRPDPTPIPTPSPAPDPTTVHTVTPPTLSFTIITILALIAVAIGIFYYYYRRRKGSKSTSSVSSTSSYSNTRSRRSRDHKKKKKKKNRKGGKHRKDGSFFSSLSNFTSWAPRRKDKKNAKKGGKHSKVSSIVPSQSSAVSNSSIVSSSPITRLHDKKKKKKKKKKVRNGGKHPKVSNSIYNSNSSIVSISPITRRQSPDKKKMKKSPKDGKNRRK